ELLVAERAAGGLPPAVARSGGALLRRRRSRCILWRGAGPRRLGRFVLTAGAGRGAQRERQHPGARGDAAADALLPRSHVAFSSWPTDEWVGTRVAHSGTSCGRRPATGRRRWGWPRRR